MVKKVRAVPAQQIVVPKRMAYRVPLGRDVYLDGEEGEGGASTVHCKKSCLAFCLASKYFDQDIVLSHSYGRQILFYAQNVLFLPYCGKNFPTSVLSNFPMPRSRKGLRLQHRKISTVVQRRVPEMIYFNNYLLYHIVCIAQWYATGSVILMLYVRIP